MSTVYDKSQSMKFINCCKQQKTFLVTFADLNSVERKQAAIELVTANVCECFLIDFAAFLQPWPHTDEVRSI